MGKCSPACNRHSQPRCEADDRSEGCLKLSPATSVALAVEAQAFQSDVVQHGICKQSLQPMILLLEGFQFVSIARVHPAVIGFELVKRGRVQPVGPTNLSCWNSTFVLFKHPNDLLLVEPALTHLSAPY